MKDNNKKPFLFSPQEMKELRILTEKVQALTQRSRARRNLIDSILGAFKYPIKETRKYVYHVSGFNLKVMYDILFGKGLKWGNKKDKGIFYNTSEFVDYMDAYSIFKLGKVKDRRHVSYFHMQSFYLCDQLRGIARHENTGDPMWCSKGQYRKRFGLIPLNVTYEIDTQGFEEGAMVYEDPTHVYTGAGSITAEDGLWTFARYIPQERIPSKYIRLKAISFAFPWLWPIFGDAALFHKVLWRRK